MESRRCAGHRVVVEDQFVKDAAGQFIEFAVARLREAAGRRGEEEEDECFHSHNFVTIRKARMPGPSIFRAGVLARGFRKAPPQQ